MIRATCLRIQVSNVETILVPDVEHNCTVVACETVIVKATRVAVDDSLSKISRRHLVSHLVDNANHSFVVQVRVLVHNSGYVLLRVVNAL